jgi:Ni/Fe-hydrogenase 1 B-type cytochrome subunit
VKKKFGKYNAGQKLLYTLWPILLLFQAVTGFAMYFPETFSGFIYLFGGLNHFRVWHVIGAWIFTITTIAHIYLGTTGLTLFDFYKQMITGYEKDFKSTN